MNQNKIWLGQEGVERLGSTPLMGTAKLQFTEQL